MELKVVRSDLCEIKYYYSQKDTFEEGQNFVKPVAVLNKVERYNKVMENAPARLYTLYIHLYVKGNSQSALADKWNYTVDYLCKWNNELCEYLGKNL